MQNSACSQVPVTISSSSESSITHNLTFLQGCASFESFRAAVARAPNKKVQLSLRLLLKYSVLTAVMASNVPLLPVSFYLILMEKTFRPLSDIRVLVANPFNKLPVALRSQRAFTCLYPKSLSLIVSYLTIATYNHTFTTIPTEKRSYLLHSWSYLTSARIHSRSTHREAALI